MEKDKMTSKFDSQGVQATVTAHDGTVTTYYYAPHPGRLEELHSFYRALYLRAAIADYQVITA